MTSAIDPTIIGVGPVVKTDMKAQLQTAKDEISALQAYVTGVLPRNRFLNGAFFMNQQFGVTTVDCTTGATYVTDGWVAGLSGGPPGGTLRSQTVVSASPGGSPFRQRFTVQVADAAIAAGDFYNIEQQVEGFYIGDARLGTASAKSLQVRIGVRSSLAGTFGISFGNSANNRVYVTTFTIAVGQVNTDLTFTFTIPGDTSGTWLTDTGIGLRCRICLSAGTTWQTAGGAWTAGNLLTTASQTNFMGTGAATFELFDCGLYVDTQASGVIPPWQLPEYVSELHRALRYYEPIELPGLLLPVVSAGAFSGAIVQMTFKNVKRVSPTITLYSAATGGGTAGVLTKNGAGTSALFLTSATIYGVAVWNNGALTVAADWANGSLTASARL